MIGVLLCLTTIAPASETAYGCYEPNVRMMYPDLARLNFRDLARRGFTTSTVSGNASAHFGPTMQIGLARQVDMMIEEGIARKDRPMLCLSADAVDIAGAKQYAAHPDRWPELVLGNVDEPNVTQIKTVREYSCKARESGVRNGTAIAGYSLYQPGADAADGCIADWLDLWIVLASTWQTDLYEKAKQQTADLYAYWAYPREADRDRYVAGLWCWRWSPRTFYFWAYNHSGLHGTLPNGEHLEDPADTYSLATGSLAGPVGTPSLEAVAEGIKDHALLDRLKDSGRGGAWLKDLWDSIPVCMPPPPKPVPRTDFAGIRREAERRLRG